MCAASEHSPLRIPLPGSSHCRRKDSRPNLTFLGIELDSVQKVARLPQDKVDDIRSRLLAFRQRKSCRLRELEQLLGKLNFASRVITPGRTFMRRLYDATLNVSKPYHRIRLSPECHLDLFWWSHLLDGWNGKSFFLDLQETLASDILIESDASGAIGHGAVYGTLVCRHLVTTTHSALHCVQGAVSQWCRKRIRFHTDNEAVAAVLKSGSSRCTNVISLLRQLFFICAKGNFMVTTRHIPGTTNILADALSRQDFKRFHSCHPTAAHMPTPVRALPSIPGETSAVPCTAE